MQNFLSQSMESGGAPSKKASLAELTVDAGHIGLSQRARKKYKKAQTTTSKSVLPKGTAVQSVESLDGSAQYQDELFNEVPSTVPHSYHVSIESGPMANIVKAHRSQQSIQTKQNVTFGHIGSVATI